MKKNIAIFFAAIMLFSQTELHQLIKLPVFIQHFKEHRQEDKNISLAGFIILHYFSGDIRDADYERDMQLPFKTLTCNEWAQVQLSVVPAFHKIDIPVSTALSIVFNSNYISFIPPVRIADIWQPPRANC